MFRLDLLTCFLGDTDGAMPRITDRNTALRSLDIQTRSPHCYIYHLPTYIKNPQIEEVWISFLMEFDEMRAIWTSLDRLIFQSLAKNPRENFTLHLKMDKLDERYQNQPLSGEQLARSVFPLCDALGIVNCVSDGAGWSDSGPVLSRSLLYKNIVDKY